MTEGEFKKRIEMCEELDDQGVMLIGSGSVKGWLDEARKEFPTEESVKKANQTMNAVLPMCHRSNYTVTYQIFGRRPS